MAFKRKRKVTWKKFLKRRLSSFSSHRNSIISAACAILTVVLVARFKDGPLFSSIVNQISNTFGGTEEYLNWPEFSHRYQHKIGVNEKNHMAIYFPFGKWLDQAESSGPADFAEFLKHSKLLTSSLFSSSWVESLVKEADLDSKDLQEIDVVTDYLRQSGSKETCEGNKIRSHIGGAECQKIQAKYASYRGRSPPHRKINLFLVNVPQVFYEKYIPVELRIEEDEAPIKDGEIACLLPIN